MTSHLINYDVAPPGGYPYEQKEGVYRKFPSQPLIEAQADLVADFRKGNHLPRATKLEALEDISAYTCQRLGGMTRFCTGSHHRSNVALNASSALLAPCRGCGATIT